MTETTTIASVDTKQIQDYLRLDEGSFRWTFWVLLLAYPTVYWLSTYESGTRSKLPGIKTVGGIFQKLTAPCILPCLCTCRLSSRHACIASCAG